MTTKENTIRWLMAFGPGILLTIVTRPDTFWERFTCFTFLTLWSLITFFLFWLNGPPKMDPPDPPDEEEKEDESAV